MLLENKKGIVVGVANKNSIAWGISESLLKQGAEVAFTCQTERLAGKLEKILQSKGYASSIDICDACDDESIKKSVSSIAEKFGGTIDFLIHSIAFAQKEDLDGAYVDTSRKGFALSMDVSVYSLNAFAQRVVPFMTDGGSIVTMSYLGAERVVPGYNVMGVSKSALESTVRYLAFDLGSQNIRVNAISAGPVNTLAARGIAHFSDMYRQSAERAPLKSTTTIDEVGDSALFLVSSLSRGITGEVIHVDKGLHIL